MIRMIERVRCSHPNISLDMSTFTGVEGKRPDAVLTGVLKTDCFKSSFSNFTSSNFSLRLQTKKKAHTLTVRGL